MPSIQHTPEPAVLRSEKGAINGVASLDSNGLVPNSQLPGATQSAAGTMSAADKTKLDGIATGATANVVSDSLSDTSTTNALSAAKGKALNDSITALNTQIATLMPLSGYVIHGSWKSGQPLTIPSGGTYSSILFMGYLQGHAHLFLRLVKGNGTLSVQNLDGTAFTSGYHTFTLSGNDIVISSTAGGKSEGTFVAGAWT